MMEQRGHLLDIAGVFARLRAIAFCGATAALSEMQREVVSRRAAEVTMSTPPRRVRPDLALPPRPRGKTPLARVAHARGPLALCLLMALGSCGLPIHGAPSDTTAVVVQVAPTHPPPSQVASPAETPMRSGLAPGGAIPSTVWGWGAFAPGGVSGGARRALLPVGGLGGVIAIATGAEHAVALTARGAVWAWGNRIPGMGTHTSAYPEAPTRIPGLDEIVAIAAGDYHSLALRDDGTVWAWGFNGSGQLGDGTTTPRRLPRPVEGLPDPIAVAAGQAHNLVLQRDGTVWAWGQGAYGQLGNGNLVPQHRPIPVPGLESMAGIAAGGRHSLAVGHDGAVWAWGNGRYGALGTGTLDSPPRAVRLEYLPEVVSVAAGWNHSLALTRAGEVWAWGDNQQGQLGLGSSGGVIPVPQPVAGVSSVVAIAAGYQHSLALRDDGTVWAWGSNRDGALGTGRPEGISDATPSPVEGLHGITAIAARGTYSIALQGPQARRLPPPTFAPTTAGSARR